MAIAMIHFHADGISRQLLEYLDQRRQGKTMQALACSLGDTFNAITA
jgi:hypothetical protein